MLWFSEDKHIWSVIDNHAEIAMTTNEFKVVVCLTSTCGYMKSGYM